MGRVYVDFSKKDLRRYSGHGEFLKTLYPVVIPDVEVLKTIKAQN
jgi:hypothetical protein